MTVINSTLHSESLLERLKDNRYCAYAYSYPHKTAYRTFEAPRQLSDVWKNEKCSSLFLYFHIPFCEMRCGFCNLFTTAHPASEQERLYMQSLALQARAVKASISAAQVANVAIGGGTPTFLSLESLEELFEIAERTFGVKGHEIPIGIETSPGTANPEKLELLKRKNVHRVSIGVQSFVESELKEVGRGTNLRELENALAAIKEQAFPIFNIDLIYGLPSQTQESWLYSLERSMQFNPEEIFIYPLYVRPLTGMGRRGKEWEDSRDKLYSIACSFLKQHDYEQLSMRMFRRKTTAASGSTKYCCQVDGMIGIGAGARSYTKSIHYSGAYAVQKEEVKSIIDRYIQLTERDFSFVSYGIELDQTERKRRFIIQSLLQSDGLSIDAYQAEFASNPLSDINILNGFIAEGIAYEESGFIKLNALGLSLSDSISYALYSEEIKELMNSYEAK